MARLAPQEVLDTRFGSFVTRCIPTMPQSIIEGQAEIRQYSWRPVFSQLLDVNFVVVGFSDRLATEDGEAEPEREKFVQLRFLSPDLLNKLDPTDRMHYGDFWYALNQVSTEEHVKCPVTRVDTPLRLGSLPLAHILGDLDNAQLDNQFTFVGHF